MRPLLRVYKKQLDSKATGKNIRARRMFMKMSAGQLAKLICRSRAYVSRIESGERTIKSNIMGKIEKALL